MGRRARQTLTERRAEELRLEIAETAVKMFVADGDTSATVERIAEAAGVAPRTFYRHFAVKEDVVLPLFRRSTRIMTTALENAPRDGDLIDTLVSTFLIEMHERPLTEADRTLLKIMNSAPQYRLRWLEIDEELCEAVADFLATRVGRVSDPLQRTLPAYVIVKSVRKVFEHWVSTDYSHDIETLLRRGFGMIFAGLNAWSDDGCSARSAIATPGHSRPMPEILHPA